MAARATDHAVTSLVTADARERTATVELETSYKADDRPRQPGGISVPPLWRESGSGNARGCPCTVFNSRRQGGLKAFLAMCFNAYKEAAMTGAQPHPSHDRRDRVGDLNRYPEREDATPGMETVGDERRVVAEQIGPAEEGRPPT